MDGYYKCVNFQEKYIYLGATQKTQKTISWGQAPIKITSTKNHLSAGTNLVNAVRCAGR